MKARILGQVARVYSQPDLNSLPIADLMNGYEVEMGGVTKNAAGAWVGVALPNGQRGYFSGDTKILHIKTAILLQKEALVYAEPSALSVVKTRYRRRARFYLADAVDNDGRRWVRVRDFGGAEGFIDGATKIKVLPEVTKASGAKNMLFGALWCIGGIIVTAVTYNMASSGGGGRYFIAWGPVVFGAFQFFNGLFQFLKARV
jgi:hypothetical protein